LVVRCFLLLPLSFAQSLRQCPDGGDFPQEAFVSNPKQQ
jgi:hypothetical protein